MTTDTGMTAVGMIVGTIGAETTGAEISGVESKPAEKLNAIVIGSATRTGPCGTVTRTLTVTIVASAKPWNNPPATRGDTASLQNQDSNRSEIAVLAYVDELRIGCLFGASQVKSDRPQWTEGV
jgi:hypothetical protein